jgi:hypothetical protein
MDAWKQYKVGGADRRRTPFVELLWNKGMAYEEKTDKVVNY